MKTDAWQSSVMPVKSDFEDKKKHLSWKKRVTKPNRQLFDVNICKRKDFGMEKLLPLHICYTEVGKSFLVWAKCIREKFWFPWQNIFPCLVPEEGLAPDG